MFRLSKTPHNRRRTLVFVGDMLIMLATISFLIFFHAFMQRYGVLDTKRPLKAYAMYTCLPVHLFLGYIFEVYDVKRKEKLRTLTLLSTLSFLSFCFMFGSAKILYINQTTMVYIFILFIVTVFTMYFWRSTYKKVFLGSRYLTKHKVLFIENDLTTAEILQEITRRDYRILGMLADNRSYHPNTIKGLKVLGSLDELPRIVHNRKPDILITAVNKSFPLDVLKTIYRCKFSGCDVYDSFYFYELFTKKTALKHYIESESIPYFDVDVFARRHYGRIKTITDISLAAFALLILWPLMLIIAIFIKLISKGPVLFTQERIGLHEKPFNLIKFRTMVVDAEHNGPQWSKKNDSRVTPVGKFLRKSKLDELPQLINICKGEMSFIGPRPIRAQMASLIEESMPFYSLRFTVKPGLTGWAQVNYDYGGTVEGHVEKFQYDLYYLKHASLFLDVHIILKTLQTIMRKPTH